MADLEKHDTDVEVTVKPETEMGNIAYESIFGNDVPPRTLGFIEIIAAGFNICNSWSGLAATLFLGFLSGGPVTIIWGMFVATFVTGCGVLSLAELAAKYPTAGGQYHWTHILAPPSAKRSASYIAAITNIFSWLAITASVCVIIPQLILGMAKYWNPSYIPHKYQFFLIYQVSNILFVGYNLAILRRAAWTHNVGMAFSLLCFLTFWIACLAKASPNFQSSSYVWTNFVNEDSGWPDGVVFLTGMVNANFMYVGVDGAVHLAEDALNAATAVPWALIAAVGIGFITTLPFVVSMFYCITNPNDILESPVPIFGILLQATGSPSGATAMTTLILVTGYFALNATIQTSSRLTWSLARDGGLVFSERLSHVHQGLGVPVWALLANAFAVFVMGCIYLGSTVAFNAIVGTCLILMHLTIAIPIIFLMYQRRAAHFLPRKGHWNMGTFGWLANFWSVAWAFIILVFYCFPTTTPTTGSEMNYASAVLAVMFIFGVINWFAYARTHFTEPRINLEKLAQLEAMKQ
ncbi:hypothetical protein DV736_g2869, partial [Chaetothyriales sp. CBS 134916]